MDGSQPLTDSSHSLMVTARFLPLSTFLDIPDAGLPNGFASGSSLPSQLIKERCILSAPHWTQACTPGILKHAKVFPRAPSSHLSYPGVFLITSFHIASGIQMATDPSELT